MALETWLVKVKTALSTKLRPNPPPKKPVKKLKVGVLAFEIAGLMSKLLHQWHSLSEKQVARLKHESISLVGVRKLVSNDESFLLALACAELILNLKTVAKSVSRISKKSTDTNLVAFEYLLDQFADSGHDPNCWVLGFKEMEAHNKRLDGFVTATTALYKEMEELTIFENSFRKSPENKDLQHKILFQKHEIKILKEKSLWNRSYDTATSLLAKSVFTVLARIKIVFGISFGNRFPTTLPRSLSASATVHPSENPDTCSFVSGPLAKNHDTCFGFFENNLKLMKPPPNTLGAAALALHYSNLIIVIEKMIKSPQLVGLDARDDLYSMLPDSIRSSLRARLKGIYFSAGDHVLAGEWRDALGKILGWLAQLAHNMIRWQSERSFEQQQNLIPKTNVLLLKTLFFANKEKTEAAITELLVGLNYIWRFEREMNAKALFESANKFNGFLKSGSGYF